VVKVRRAFFPPSHEDIGESLDDLLPAVSSLKRPRDSESSSGDTRKDKQPSSSIDSIPDGRIRVTSSERKQLRAAFRKEAKQARSKFRDGLVVEWHETYPSMGGKENQKQDHSSSDSGFGDDELAYDHFANARLETYDHWAAERQATFVSSLRSRPPTPISDQTSNSVRLQQDRTQALWEGLRRKFFGETELEPDLDDTLETQGEDADVARVLSLRDEIATLMEQLRRRQVRFPADSPPPPFISPGSDPDDSDDFPPAQPLAMASQGSVDASSFSPKPRRSNRTKPTPAAVSAPVRRRAKDRWVFEQVPITDQFDGGVSSSNQGAFLAQNLSEGVSSKVTPLHQIPGGVSFSNRGVLFAHNSSGEFSPSNPIPAMASDLCGGISSAVSFLPAALDTPPVFSQAHQDPKCDPNDVMTSFVDANGNEEWATPRSLLFETPVLIKASSAMVSSSPETIPTARRVLLSPRTIRKILVAKETLFKFGTFVPRNELEAQRSPEASRWLAGRDLEWLRMGQRETFARDWTWNRMQREFPKYKKSEIGHLFYVFDYKYSGEHRVRLVFDGSRQSPSTFTETYAPAARQESVRLFHIVLVEEGYFMGQYDVPQAFLLAPIDSDIFVYPPKGQSEYPGQILKLQKALYGGKQSAYLWFTMINAFILELGFISSPMDSCLYKRSDAILILYCDDLRIGASKTVLESLKTAFYDRFQITTAAGDRFLGMDTMYHRDEGYLKFTMTTYIDATVARFHQFDLSCGVPFRELVGCLLWITLCVMGPELLRVKDLARRSNNYTQADYQDGLKVLARISERKFHGIVFFRNAATRELLPAYRRPQADDLSEPHDTGDLIGSPDASELTLKSLCHAKAVSPSSDSSSSSYVVPDTSGIEIPTVILPVNPRYRLIGFGDASFAIGPLKQSVSGFVVYLNGVPLLWGSLKQTIVVDSSCSAEFVAASIVSKQILMAENMIGFLGFSCPKPYRLYTDSMACLHIATNPARLGNVRHLHIRYHLVRCVVSFGDIVMFFCVTEAMIADLFTKIVSGAQDQRLSARFYSLMPGSSGLVLGISPLDPTTFDSRASSFLYPDASN
jgi:hypothetical protein